MAHGCFPRFSSAVIDGPMRAGCESFSIVNPGRGWPESINDRPGFCPPGRNQAWAGRLTWDIPGAGAPLLNGKSQPIALRLHSPDFRVGTWFGWVSL